MCVKILRACQDAKAPSRVSAPRHGFQFRPQLLGFGSSYSASLVVACKWRLHALRKQRRESISSDLFIGGNRPR